eukprot:3392773-Rhodomonas_salina.2
MFAPGSTTHADVRLRVEQGCAWRDKCAHPATLPLSSAKAHPLRCRARAFPPVPDPMCTLRRRPSTPPCAAHHRQPGMTTEVSCGRAGESLVVRREGMLPARPSRLAEPPLPEAPQASSKNHPRDDPAANAW